MSATTDNLMNVLRVNLPGAVDPAINLTLGEVVSQFRRQVLQGTPVADYSTSLDTWLTAAEWEEHHKLIASGVLAEMLAQIGKPYSNTTLAQAHMQVWQEGLTPARVVASTTQNPTTSFDRLMANLRTAVPGMRDAALQQELFNVIDDLQRNVLQATPPAHTAPASAWLSPTDYDKYYRLLLAGTLMRVLTQPGKPWSDPTNAAIRAQEYAEQITYARGDANGEPDASPSSRLMDALRVRIPSSKDTVLKMELWNTINEFCRASGAWRDDVLVTLVVNQMLYSFIPSGAELVELFTVEHATFPVAGVTYADGQLLFQTFPSAADTGTPLFVTASFAPSPLENDIDQWLPSNMWADYHDVLLDGVCSKMMMQIGKPYSNPVAAAYHGRRFNTGKYIPRQRVISDKVDKRATWRFPRFA